MCARTRRIRMRGAWTRALVTCLVILNVGARRFAARRSGRRAFRRTRESAEACAKTRVDASTQTCTFIEPEEEVDVDKAVEDVEGSAPVKVSLNYCRMERRSAKSVGYA